MLKAIRSKDTGDVWVCPYCGKTYHLLHRAIIKNGKEVKILKHDFEEKV